MRRYLLLSLTALLVALGLSSAPILQLHATTTPVGEEDTGAEERDAQLQRTSPSKPTRVRQARTAPRSRFAVKDPSSHRPAPSRRTAPTKTIGHGSQPLLQVFRI